MIKLLMASLSHVAPNGGLNVILEPTTLELPTEKRLVVLAKKQQGKSVLLRLLAGVDKPVKGRVFSDRKLSPILKYGALFHRRLTLMENVTFFARMMDVVPDLLLAAVDEFCGSDGSVGVPIDKERDEQRRIAEIGLMSILPFDCYLVDEVWLVPEKVRQRFFDGCAMRGAGVIFTTNHLQLARQFADHAIVIADGKLHPFASVEEGIKCLEGK